MKTLILITSTVWAGMVITGLIFVVTHPYEDLGCRQVSHITDGPQAIQTK